MRFRTVYGKAKIEVMASSEREAMAKIKRKYGFYPDYVEPVVDTFKTSRKHMAFAKSHAKGMGEYDG